MQVAKHNSCNIRTGNIRDAEETFGTIGKNQSNSQSVNRNTVGMRMPIIIPFKNSIN